MKLHESIRLSGALLLVALLAPEAGAGGAKDPLPNREVWYDFAFFGQKVGFLFAKDEATTVNDRRAAHVHRFSVVTVKRQAEVIRMQSTTDAWFLPDGTPLRFKHERTEGTQTRTVEGYRDGEVIVIRQNVGGNLREERIPLTPDLRLASSLDVLFNEGLVDKKKMSGRALDEAEADIQAYSIEVTGTEKHQGKTVFVVVQKVGQLESRHLVTPEGKVIVADYPGIGAAFRETTQEEAVKVDGQVDIFNRALFRVPHALPPGHQLDEVVVRISGRSGKTPRYLEDARQKAAAKVAGGVELTMTVGSAPTKPAALPVKAANLAPYLKETPYEPIKDERLTATAARVVKESKDVWTAARAINRFVHRHIETKSLAKPFATAIEALEGREGDCTEHAVLFSALAKIVGIPTRLVTGLVFVRGKENVFGYHEWVEIWTGTEWLAMDPTFGQDIADPTHIKFAVGQSDAEGLRDAGLVAAALIGDLQLEVVSYRNTSGERTKL